MIFPYISHIFSHVFPSCSCIFPYVPTILPWYHGLNKHKTTATTTTGSFDMSSSLIPALTRRPKLTVSSSTTAVIHQKIGLWSAAAAASTYLPIKGDVGQSRRVRMTRCKYIIIYIIIYYIICTCMYIHILYYIYTYTCNCI